MVAESLNSSLAKDPPMRTIRIDANKLFFIIDFLSFIFLFFIPGSPLRAGTFFLAATVVPHASGIRFAAKAN
jgi:hypothetical protein